MLSLSAKMDALVGQLSNLRAISAATKTVLEQAADLVALVSAKGDRNHAVVVTIPIPEPYASRFPAGEHEPHITVCFVTKEDIDNGTYSQIEAAVRRAAKQVAPFRVYVNTNAGLKDFGEGPNGNKALWFEVLSAENDGVKNEPLERMFKAIRSSLLAEKLPCEAHDTYKGHTTWTYVPNDQSLEDKTAMSSFAASRFNDGPFAFAVRSVVLSSPDGKKTVVTLNPQAPKVKASLSAGAQPKPWLTGLEAWIAADQADSDREQKLWGKPLSKSPWRTPGEIREAFGISSAHIGDMLKNGLIESHLETGEGSVTKGPLGRGNFRQRAWSGAQWRLTKKALSFVQE